MQASELSDSRSRISYWDSRLLVIALLLISFYWHNALHIYFAPKSASAGVSLLIIAYLLLLVRNFNRPDSAWTKHLIVPRWTCFLGTVACIAGYIWLPFPYSLGLILLAAGWLPTSLLKRYSFPWFFTSALLQLGGLLVISTALLPLIFNWAAKIHELPQFDYLLNPIIDAVLHLFNQSAHLVHNAIILRTYEDQFTLSLTTEKLFPISAVLFLILWSVTLFFRSTSQRIERLLFFWFLFLVYSILRIIALYMILLQRQNPDLFWHPYITLSSYLPLIFLLQEPRDLSKLKRPRGVTTLQKQPVLVNMILGSLLGICLVLWLGFRDPGALKPGRILIQEHGSDWEWTTEPMDTITYNEKTTYNYYCLAEYLKYFYQVRVNDEPLSTAALKDVDVLIIKIPTEPYAAAEIEAVEQFVKQGGGVWIIGDHTNVFGSSSYLNPLLKRFGCRLRYDSTHDLKSGKLSLWEKPPLFAHPSVAHLPPYLFATSCSVTAPLSAENAIIGYGLRKDFLDYSQRNFFPDRSKKLFDIGFGLFLQQVAVPYGKGRLLIYTDSTTFSNFFMFIKGKPEIALGAVDWVNRTNRLNWLNRAAFWSALVILLLMLVLHAWNGAAIAGLLSFTVLFGWFIDHQNIAAYPMQEPVRNIPYINFDRQLSQYFLPTLRLMESGDRDFHTFFVWTQRVGAVPREMHDLDRTLQSNDPLVLIDPAPEISPQTIADIDRFVRAGGKLLLIHSADIAASSTSRIVQKFGLSLQTELTDSDTTHTVTLANRSFPLRLHGKVAIVQGGEPFWLSDQGDVIGAKIEVGKGQVWFVSAGHLFRNDYLGSTTLVPDEGLKALFQVEYQIILDIMQ